MTLDVPSEYEDIIRQAVASGAFADEQAVLRRALQLLAEQQRQSSADVSNEDNDHVTTAYEAFARLGVIGCMQKGHVDLATNPKHMDGFGQ